MIFILLYKFSLISILLCSFSYMGHAVWPSVFHSMLSPTHYRTVVWVTIALITIWYTLVAAFGYYLYGDDVHDNVSLDIRLGKWFVALLNILICFTVGAKFALAAFPIVECFEDLLDSDYLKSVISGELQVPSTGYTGWGQSIQAQLLACIRLFKQLVKRIKTFFSGVISGILRHWLPPTPISPSAFRSISSKSGTGRTRGRSVRAQGTVTGECTPLMHSSGDIERASLATNSSVSTDGSIDSDFEALLAPIRSRQRRWQWKLFPIKDKEKRSLAQTNSGSSIDDGDCHGQGDFLNLQEEESEGKYVGEKSSTHGQYQNNVSNSNPDVRDHDYELGHVSMEPMSTGHQPSNSHDISFEREEKEAEEAEDRGSDMTNREKEQQSTMSHTRCLFIARTLLPVLVLLLYLALPSFLQLVTIIGGVFGTLICLVFPLLFYLFLCHDEMSILSTIVSWIGVVVGVGIAVAVSIASI